MGLEGKESILVAPSNLGNEGATRREEIAPRCSSTLYPFAKVVLTKGHRWGDNHRKWLFTGKGKVGSF